MFIAAEMGNCKREIAEMEKDKKVRIEFHTRCNAALIILDHLDQMTTWQGLQTKSWRCCLRWKGIQNGQYDDQESAKSSICW